MNSKTFISILASAFFCVTVHADEVISDNLVVQSSLCIGVDCEDGEEFGFDTLRLKTTTPILKFLDTSNSGAFPGNDWSMGIGDNDGGESPGFFIRDDNSDLTVLQLNPGPDGGIALGAGATIEAGAISVGAPGAERRIVNIADGIGPSDAVSVGQFNAFTDRIVTDFDTELAAERAALDSRITELRGELDDLSSRLDTLTTRLGIE